MTFQVIDIVIDKVMLTTSYDIYDLINSIQPLINIRPKQPLGVHKYIACQFLEIACLPVYELPYSLLQFRYTYALLY